MSLCSMLEINASRRARHLLLSLTFELTSAVPLHSRLRLASSLAPGSPLQLSFSSLKPASLPSFHLVHFSSPGQFPTCPQHVVLPILKSTQLPVLALIIDVQGCFLLS